MAGRLSRAQFLRFSAVSAVGAVIACAPPPPAPTATTAPAAAKPAAGQPPAAAAPTAAPAPKPAAATKPAAAVATATPREVQSADIGRATAVAFQGKYKEAPMLADMVKAGKLPPVEQRLPQNPYVVPHKWVTPGKYGGHMQWATSSGDGNGTWRFVQESMYGHSPLRWLRDGLEIGPGLVEKWETNKDQSEWTLFFRKGLKWSDGQAWTVDDVLFWWEDEVQNPELKEFPPDESRSGKGTLAKFQKVDDSTLKMVFDAPAPLTADRLAMWVNRGIGPRWMDPKHYLKQFHPKYNPSVDKSKWIDTFLEKREFARNPESPTMTGWMLVSYEKGQRGVWTRNPYYWVIDKDGNQLPFIDGITMTNIQDPQVFRLHAADGKLDYHHGNFGPLNVADIATLRNAQPKSKLTLDLWDGGSGGSGPFFSQDYFEPEYRKLFRDHRWLRAMSHAINRAQIQKVVWFGTGELTTGTLSPKALEFHVPGGNEIYQSWRDAAIKYDPDTAKKLLDELGVKDVDNDGFRELPGGKKLEVTLDYPADQDPNGTNLKQDAFIQKDWEAVGVKTKLNPVPPASWDDRWRSGHLQVHAAWGYGDGPNLLVYPQWLTPIEASRWAPLQGRFYEVRGTPKEKEELNVDPYERKPPRMPPEPGGPVEKIWQIYDQSKVETDQMKRVRMVWDMIKIHVDNGPYFYGMVANTPSVILAKDGLKNVPKRADLALGGFTGPWIIPAPAVYDPEAYFWDNPDQHKAP